LLKLNKQQNKNIKELLKMDFNKEELIKSPL